MKHQYFGDVNDYRKYGLLRTLSGGGRIRPGVCWMLTESDFSRDGRKLRYLDAPGSYRDYDPELFDFLEKVVVVENDRDVRRFEQSRLLPDALFYNEPLTDDAEHRSSYFDDALLRLGEADLVFFDPDNGLEVRSVPRGRKGSSRYLYRSELARTCEAGHSALLYQHFTRERRETFVPRMVAEVREQTGAPKVHTFHTPHVLFLLAARPEHAEYIRRRADQVAVEWEGQIQVEHYKSA